jgi:hypothetical protein
MKIKKKIHFVVAITFYYFYKIAYEPFKMSPKICFYVEGRWNIRKVQMTMVYEITYSIPKSIVYFFLIKHTTENLSQMFSRLFNIIIKSMFKF